MQNCSNFNHNKKNVSVRFCSICGEVVNKKIQIKNCGEFIHAKKRKERSKFCTDCGNKLVA